MLAAYVAALAVALGILAVQILTGKDGHDAGGDDLDHADGAGHGDSGALVGVFFSLRFWTFTLLGFGLSGSLLHVFQLASSWAVAMLAGGTGAASGLFAALVFRALMRSASPVAQRASNAIGKEGRVLIPCSRGQVGQVRIELEGSSLDLMATTDELEIPRGGAILVEDVRGGVAHVSSRPLELL
jgi:membrane protein implicated in regulation of membrane protease activity